MELATIEMERPKARAAFLEYRKAVREEHGKAVTEAQKRLALADEQIMRGYRELARGEATDRADPDDHGWRVRRAIPTSTGRGPSGSALGSHRAGRDRWVHSVLLGAI